MSDEENYEMKCKMKSKGRKAHKNKNCKVNNNTLHYVQMTLVCDGEDNKRE